MVKSISGPKLRIKGDVKGGAKPLPGKKKEPDKAAYRVVARLIDDKSKKPVSQKGYEVVSPAGKVVATGKTDWQGGVNHPVPEAGNYTVRLAKEEAPKAYEIKATVVDQGGAPLAGAPFEVVAADGKIVSDAETDASGAIAAGVDKEGEYTLRILHPRAARAADPDGDAGGEESGPRVSVEARAAGGEGGGEAAGANWVDREEMPQELVEAYERAAQTKWYKSGKCLQFAAEVALQAGATPKTHMSHHPPPKGWGDTKDTSFRGTRIRDLPKAVDAGALKPGMVIHVKAHYDVDPPYHVPNDAHHWFIYMGKKDGVPQLGDNTKKRISSCAAHAPNIEGWKNAKIYGRPQVTAFYDPFKSRRGKGGGAAPQPGGGGAPKGEAAPKEAKPPKGEEPPKEGKPPEGEGPGKSEGVAPAHREGAPAEPTAIAVSAGGAVDDTTGPWEDHAADSGKPEAGKDVRADLLAQIRKARAAIPPEPGMKVAKGGEPKFCYYGEVGHDGKAGGHADYVKSFLDGKIAQASGVAKRQIQSFRTLQGEEGTTAAINSWDNQIVTWGSGYSGLGRLSYVMDALLGSPGAMTTFSNCGFRYRGKNTYDLVDLESAKVLTWRKGKAEGKKFWDVFRRDRNLLHMLIHVARDPKTRDAVTEAQLKAYQQCSANFERMEKIHSFEFFHYAAHLKHWMPACFKGAVAWAAENAGPGGPSEAYDKKLAKGVVIHFYRRAKSLGVKVSVDRLQRGWDKLKKKGFVIDETVADVLKRAAL